MSISRFTRVNGDASLPLGFGFQHPSFSSLQPRVARGHLVGFDSMARRAAALWTQMNSGCWLLLGLLVYTGGYLRTSVTADLFAMVGQHLTCGRLRRRSGLEDSWACQYSHCWQATLMENRRVMVSISEQRLL